MGGAGVLLNSLSVCDELVREFLLSSPMRTLLADANAHLERGGEAEIDKWLSQQLVKPSTAASSTGYSYYVRSVPPFLSPSSSPHLSSSFPPPSTTTAPPTSAFFSPTNNLDAPKPPQSPKLFLPSIVSGASPKVAGAAGRFVSDPCIGFRVSDPSFITVLSSSAPTVSSDPSIKSPPSPHISVFPPPSSSSYTSESDLTRKSEIIIHKIYQDQVQDDEQDKYEEERYEDKEQDHKEYEGDNKEINEEQLIRKDQIIKPLEFNQEQIRKNDQITTQDKFTTEQEEETEERQSKDITVPGEDTFVARSTTTTTTTTTTTIPTQDEGGWNFDHKSSRYTIGDVGSGSYQISATTTGGKDIGNDLTCSITSTTAFSSADSISPRSATTIPTTPPGTETPDRLGAAEVPNALRKIIDFDKLICEKGAFPLTPDNVCSPPYTLLFDGALEAAFQDMAEMDLPTFEKRLCIDILSIGKFLSWRLFYMLVAPGNDKLTLDDVKSGFRGRFVHHSEDPTTLRVIALPDEGLEHVFSAHSVVNFFSVLKLHRHSDFITKQDVEKGVQELLSRHPGLHFLKGHEEFAVRYVDTVVGRIFYELDDLGVGQLHFKQLRNSDLVHIWCSLDDSVQISSLRKFFSYEHFYVIYCQFFSLDDDYDLLLSKDDLLRYSDHALSLLAVERLFSVVPFLSTVPGRMCYDDFIWFVMSYEDATSDRAIELWFQIVDLDGDGCIRDHEIQVFFEEQVSRLAAHTEAVDVKFEDFLCQMNDAVAPRREGQFYLSDFKRCRKYAGVFFQALISLPKFLNWEQRDAHTEKQQADAYPSYSLWEIFCKEKYLHFAAGDAEPEDEDSDSNAEDEYTHFDLLGAETDSLPMDFRKIYKTTN